MAEEKLLILPLGDEASKKISQVMTNETSRKILEILCDEPLSTTQISEKLNAPLTTLHYNIENLLDAGLIKVEKVKYSEKGKEVKYYSPTRKFILIAPENIEKEKVKDTLKKVLFGVYFIFAATFSGYFFQRLYYMIMPPVMKAAAPAERAAEQMLAEAPPVAAPLYAEKALALGAGENITITQAPPSLTPLPIGGEAGGQIIMPDFVLWFIFGALFALVLIFVWRKIEVRIK